MNGNWAKVGLFITLGLAFAVVLTIVFTSQEELSDLIEVNTISEYVPPIPEGMTEPLQIDNQTGFVYGIVDANTLQTKELLRTSQQYYSFLPSDDGTMALAEVSQWTESSASLYVMLDLKQGGEIVKVFQPNELSYPQWVRNNNTFVYASFKDGANVVDIYDVLTSQMRTIWTSPHQGSNHEGLRWARAYTIPGVDTLYIMDYRSISDNYGFTYTADLYELNHFDESNPLLSKDFQRGICEGMKCFDMFDAVSPEVIFYLQSIEGVQESPYHEYLLYNTVDQVRVRLELEPEVNKTLVSVIALDESRVLVVHESLEQEQWTYAFTIYYPLEQRHEFLLKAKEWTGYSSHGQSIALDHDRFIVGAGEQGAILDLAKGTLTRVDYEPVGQAGERIYWTKRLE